MKYKITFLLSNQKIGGAEKVSLTLAERFEELGYAVDFVFVNGKGKLLSGEHDFNVIDLKCERIIKSIPRFAKYLKYRNPDAVISVMNEINIVAIIARMLSGVKTRLVTTIHSHTSISLKKLPNFRGQYLLRYCMYVYRWADSVICVSKGVAEDFEKIVSIQNDKINVIFNPFHIEQIKKQEGKGYELKKNGILEEERIIISIGNLKAAKDYATLLRAFSLVTEKTGAKLLILGEGDMRDELEDLANKLQIQHQVFMPGFVSNPYSYFIESDLFVLSSAWEGFGNVIVEALACGVPVVSTDCKSGPAEILKDGEIGDLVPVGDPQALSEAMLENLEKKHDKEKLKRRAQDFSVENIAEQYLELLFPENKK